MFDYYFAYGSNLNRARMIARGLAFNAAERGLLHGYRLAFNKRSKKHLGAASANVMEAPGEFVEGALYRLLDEEQILVMDPFEGYPIGYDRQRLPIAVATGDVVHAWVYIATAEYIDEGLRPARWYLNHLLTGRQFLSDGYYRKLLAVECLAIDEEPT